MPRYFYDVSNGVLVKDEVGFEADDVASMHCKALQVAADAVEALARPNVDENMFSVFVRNEADRRVLTVRRNPIADRP